MISVRHQVVTLPALLAEADLSQNERLHEVWSVKELGLSGGGFGAHQDFLAV